MSSRDRMSRWKLNLFVYVGADVLPAARHEKRKRRVAAIAASRLEHGEHGARVAPEVCFLLAQPAAPVWVSCSSGRVGCFPTDPTPTRRVR